LAAYEACRLFHDIIYGCDILIHCDHKNITNAETKHTNLHVLRRHIMLDQDYDTMFERFAGELNTGANGLRHLEMTDGVQNDVLLEFYVNDKLDHNINERFPLAMTLLKAEQDKDKKLQETLMRKRTASEQ